MVIPRYGARRLVMGARAVKVAVSLDAVVFKRIEKVRKTLKLSRSGVITAALHHWFETASIKEKVTAYETGYKRTPESQAELDSNILIASDVLAGEEWVE
jgi:hypothetical protein